MKSLRKQSPAASHASGRLKLALVALIVMLLFALAPAVSGCGGERRQGEVTIRVTSGASTADIARMLVDEDVIENERDFTKQANEAGIDQKLEAGTYRFLRGESIESILDKLEKGLQAPEGVLTIPEGYSLADIADTGVAPDSDHQKRLSGGGPA